MPQNTAHNRLSGEISERERTESWGSRAWLAKLLSDWRVGDRGKLVATALLALLRGRHGRWLLRCLIVLSVFFVYEYLILVEVIAGLLLLAEVAARFASTAQANRAESTSALNTSGDDGDDRTRPNRGRRRQCEAIQIHLQQLEMAAAATRATETAANVPPSLLPYHGGGGLTTEYPERNGTSLAVATLKTGINPQATAAPPGAPPRATFNTSSNSQAIASPRARLTSRQTPRNNHDFSTIVKSQYQRNPRNPTEWPRRGLQEPENSLVIHLQLPIYVCDIIFWNDIHITLPPLCQPSSPASGIAAASRGSLGDALDAAGLFCQIKMQMWMEVNRHVATDDKKPCRDCLMGSHYVGKRQFDCTYLEGCLHGDLDVHKNSFHTGRKLTILGSNSRLHFKFETTLEHTLARHGSTGPNVQQRATFALMAQKAKVEGSTSQQKSSKVTTGSSPKRQGGNISGLLSGVLKRNSAYTPVAKCSVETAYILEDRRLVTKEIYRNPHLGMVQNGLDLRLSGSTIASSS